MDFDRKLIVKLGICLSLFWAWPSQVYSEGSNLSSCPFFNDRQAQVPLRRPPQRVLVIPLLSKDPRTTESPRWSEQPARIVTDFYRNRFKAKVTLLKDIWFWTDYYQQIEQLLQNSPGFDRVIFISHGGFDGPVLKNALFAKKFIAIDGQVELLLASESQPGLKNTMSISYDIAANRTFSDYLASHWEELATLKTAEIWHRLKELQLQMEPLDSDCFERYCSSEKLATSPEYLREQRIDVCRSICRKPLYKVKTTAEISPERFFHFTESLRSLASVDGLIFFGTCNPGSTAPKREIKHDETDYLINTDIAEGPHNSYVHLVSAATERIVAGPIGQSSADDIVNRIFMLENGKPQRNLCIVGPAQL